MNGWLPRNENAIKIMNKKVYQRLMFSPSGILSSVTETYFSNTLQLYTTIYVLKV